MTNLYLQLKHKYFIQVAMGLKTVEYRLAKDYWRKRLAKLGSTSRIIIFDGGKIPKKEEWDKPGCDKVLEFPYRGFKEEMLLHDEFGKEPVRVFAIPLVPAGE